MAVLRFDPDPAVVLIYLSLFVVNAIKTTNLTDYTALHPSLAIFRALCISPFFASALFRSGRRPSPHLMPLFLSSSPPPTRLPSTETPPNPLPAKEHRRYSDQDRHYYHDPYPPRINPRIKLKSPPQFPKLSCSSQRPVIKFLLMVESCLSE